MPNTPRHCVIFNDNQEIKRRTSGAYRFANQLEEMGWRVTMVDWVSSWSEQELGEYLDSIVADDTVLFGISYTWMKPWYVKELTDKIRARYPGRKYIAGGQQFFQSDIGCDVMLYGYAEKAVPDTIAWLFDGGAQPKGSRPIELGGGLLIDCNKDYTAMGLGNYTIGYRDDDFVQPYELLTIELSRGCKFKCKYCNYAFLGVKQNTATEADYLRAELLGNYSRWGTTNYIIADDTFNDRNEKIKMLGDVVESLPFEPNFACFIRLDLTVAHPEQLELLSRARVWAHFYGVETLHPAAGKAVGKGMHPDKIKQGLLDMREHMMSKLGLYRGTLGMIAGLPHEPASHWHESEAWLKANWSDNSWQWWPLEISTDTNTGTVSVFSKEWQKHGYREITDTKRIEQIEAVFRKDKYDIQHKYDRRSLMWTADWADIEQATAFCREWSASQWHYDCHLLANFHILNHWKDYGHDPKALLSLTDEWDRHQQRGGNQYNDIIAPYIRRKLNSIKTIQTHLVKSKYFAAKARDNLLTRSVPHIQSNSKVDSPKIVQLHSIVA